MAGVSYSTTFDTIATTTLSNYRKKMIDNIFQGIPLFDWLLQKGRVRRLSGGLDIVEHLEYGLNTTAGAMSGYDPIDLTPQDNATVARFSWREYIVSMVISDLEKAQNGASETQMIDLVRFKQRNAERSLRDLMSGDAVGTQSGKKLDGLGTLIGTSAGTVGGLSETTYTWWAPQRITSGVNAGNLRDKMLNIYNSASQNKTSPDLIVTTQTIFEAYVTTLWPHMQYNMAESGPKLGLNGSTAFFNGKPMIWDGDMPSGVMYFLNSEFLGFVIHSQHDFTVSPMRSPVDQRVSVSHVYFMGNMTVNNRRFQGVISGISV